MSRSTNGCVTCRIRRVRCDEGKPACLNCLSTHRFCDGYIKGTLKRQKSRKVATGSQQSRQPLLMPKIYTWQSTREADIFDYFQSRTAPGTTLLLQVKFWDNLLLERTHHEPQIKHVVLALGALHRHHESGDEALRTYGLSQYSKAIQYTQEAIEKSRAGNGDMNTIMISVILFHCLENHLGNFKAAQTHLAAGMRLLRDHSTGAIEQTTLDTMHRLEFHAWTMSDATAPYDLDPNLAPDHLKVQHPKNIDEAASALIELLKWTMLISINPIEGLDGQVLALRRERCELELTTWKTSFDKLKINSGNRVARDVLEMYFILNRMILTYYSTGKETAWDRDLESWVRILEIGQRLLNTLQICEASNREASFSLEMGLIVPMFMTGLKCRDPALRREAMMILRRRKWREGMWESTGTARLLETIIFQEELGLGTISKADEVPEQNRVIMIRTQLDCESGQLRLAMYLPSLTSSTDWVIIEKVLSTLG